MSSKISEVRTLTTLHKENSSLNINPLSMLLSGIIDAAVGGGIKNYRLVFFNNDYITRHPQDEERVQTLKKLIEEQASGGSMCVSVYDSMTLCLGDRIKERSGAAWKENYSRSERNATQLGREARANGARGLP